MLKMAAITVSIDRVVMRIQVTSSKHPYQRAFGYGDYFTKFHGVTAGY
jgi:hypothetical protein